MTGVYSITESKNAMSDPHMSLTDTAKDTRLPTVEVVTSPDTVESEPHTMRNGETVTLAEVIRKGEPAT
jgi:hypothetical protein